jgi:hypothetical protein
MASMVTTPGPQIAPDNAASPLLSMLTLPKGMIPSTTKSTLPPPVAPVTNNGKLLPIPAEAGAMKR